MAETEEQPRFNTIAYWKQKLLKSGITADKFYHSDGKPLKRNELRALAEGNGILPTEEEKATLFKKKKQEDTEDFEHFDFSRFDDFVDTGPEIVKAPLHGMSKKDIEDLAGDETPGEPEEGSAEQKPAPVQKKKTTEKKIETKKPTTKQQPKKVPEAPPKKISPEESKVKEEFPNTKATGIFICIDGVIVSGNLTGHKITVH